MAVEDVVGCVFVALHVPGGHVLEEPFVGVATLELGLPDMVMRVNKARREDLRGAVNDLGVRWEVSEAGPNLNDDVIVDEYVGVRSTCDVIVSIVDQCSAVA